MNVPHVPIDPKDKDDIGKQIYELTPDEAKEYFSYIEKYQNINNYAGIPLEADVYINYISDKLKGSEDKEVTDSLRSEAENYVINYMQDSSISNIKQDDSNKKITKVKQNDSNKKVTKKISLWTKFLNFLNM